MHALTQADVGAAQDDILAACRQGLAHGCLLVMRHVMMELEWGSAPTALHSTLQTWLDDCLDALLGMADMVLPVVATPQVGNSRALMSTCMCTCQPACVFVNLHVYCSLTHCCCLLQSIDHRKMLDHTVLGYYL